MKKVIFFIACFVLVILYLYVNKNNKPVYEFEVKYIESNLQIDGDISNYDSLRDRLTDGEINEIQSLGFSPQELSGMYTSLKECNEDDFIIELANKNFDKAFLKVPKKKETKEFIAEYILRLSMADNDNFEKALNSIIRPVENPLSYPVYQGIYTLSNKRAREYINILYSETVKLLQKNSYVLLYKDVGDENNYNYLVKRSNKLLELATLFGSMKYKLDDIYSNMPNRAYIQFTKLAVSELIYLENSGEYGYSLNYEKQIIGANNSGVVLSPKKESNNIYIRTYIHKGRGQISSYIGLENGKKYEKLNSNIINIAVYKFADLMKNLTNEFMDYAYSYKKKDRHLSEMNQHVLNKNYYCGGTFSEYNGTDDIDDRIVVAGVFDPEEIKKIRTVNERGFKELLRVECGIKNPTVEFGNVGTEEDKELRRKLWSGGCNILEEPGKKFEQIRILENEYEDTSKSRISFMEILGNSNNKGEINEKK